MEQPSVCTSVEPSPQTRSAAALGWRPLEKRYLFTPGPTPVPPEVLAAAAEPIVHHRGPDFRDIYARALERLKDVFRTESDVLLFTRVRHRRDGVGGREPLRARRPGRCRQPRVVRRALDRDLRAVRARRAGDPLRVGRVARPRRGRRSGARVGRRARALPAVRHLDRRRLRRARASRRRSATRRSSSTRSRRSARCRSRPTPGGSTSSSPARRRR